MLAGGQQSAHNIALHSGVTKKTKSGQYVFNGTSKVLADGQPLWTWPLTYPGAERPLLGAGMPSLIAVNLIGNFPHLGDGAIARYPDPSCAMPRALQRRCRHLFPEAKEIGPGSSVRAFFHRSGLLFARCTNMQSLAMGKPSRYQYIEGLYLVSVLFG